MQRFNLSAWLPVFGLAVAAFIFNTSEFIPVGLLTDIGHSFHRSAADTGIMLTIYAWVVALMSLPCMLLTGHIERRKLLLGLFAIFIVSHILSAFAWNFWILIASRIGVALAHAVFWSITAALAMRVAPAGGQQKALSLIVIGSSLATIIGLPLGRMISEVSNWRTTFALIGAIAALTALLLYRLLPVIESHNSGTASSLPSLLRRPALVSLYLMTLVVVTAHFSAYSYIEPFIEQVSPLGSQFATITLFVFGLAGMAASSFFAPLNKRYPTALPISSVAVLALAMLLLLPMAAHAWSMTLVSMVWGVAMTLLALSLQVRVLDLAHDATDVAMAMFSGIFNIGIGGGALVGAQVSQNLGMSHIGEIGAVGALLGLICGGFCCWRFAMMQPSRVSV